MIPTAMRMKTNTPILADMATVNTGEVYNYCERHVANYLYYNTAVDSL